MRAHKQGIYGVCGGVFRGGTSGGTLEGVGGRDGDGEVEGAVEVSGRDGIAT